MSEYFTLVFEGDLRKFDGNPHKTDTPFGRAVRAGIGDAFEALDKAEAERDRAMEANHDRA